MRPPNAIDFWRGVALVMIFVNHIPGMAYSALTFRNYSISDAAELFVFLAGASLSFMVNGRSGASKPLGRVLVRLLIRTFEIWRAQIATVAAAIAMLSAGAITFNDPLLLEWHGAGPAFFDTVRSSIGIVLLTYQIGYFNILPLYVVLLLLAVGFVAIARISLAAAIAASVVLYVATLTFEIELPSWPADGAWFFNPLSWQLIFVLGYVGTYLTNNSDACRKTVECLWPLSVALLVVGAVVVLIDYRPDPMAVPVPRYFFLFDKMYLSPVRILSMISIAIAFYPAFPVISRWMGPAVHYCSSLGRNSLAVFCMASLMALAGQMIRYISEPTFLLDTMIVATGLVLMRVTAWLAEFQSSSAGA